MFKVRNEIIILTDSRLQEIHQNNVVMVYFLLVLITFMLLTYQCFSVIVSVFRFDVLFKANLKQVIAW